MKQNNVTLQDTANRPIYTALSPELHDHNGNRIGKSCKWNFVSGSNLSASLDSNTRELSLHINVDINQESQQLVATVQSAKPITYFDSGSYYINQGELFGITAPDMTALHWNNNPNKFYISSYPWVEEVEVYPGFLTINGYGSLLAISGTFATLSVKNKNENELDINRDPIKGLLSGTFTHIRASQNNVTKAIYKVENPIYSGTIFNYVKFKTVTEYYAIIPDFWNNNIFDLEFLNSSSLDQLSEVKFDVDTSKLLLTSSTNTFSSSFITTLNQLQYDNSWWNLSSSVASIINNLNIIKNDEFYGIPSTEDNITISTPIVLTQDTNYKNLTLLPSGSINTNGYILRVSGILDLTQASENAIHCNGGNGHSPAFGNVSGTFISQVDSQGGQGGQGGGNGSGRNLGSGKNGGSGGSTSEIRPLAPSPSNNAYSNGGSGGNGGENGKHFMTARTGSISSSPRYFRHYLVEPITFGNIPIQGGGGGAGGNSGKVG